MMYFCFARPNHKTGAMPSLVEVYASDGTEIGTAYWSIDGIYRMADRSDQRRFRLVPEYQRLVELPEGVIQLPLPFRTERRKKKAA